MESQATVYSQHQFEKATDVLKHEHRIIEKVLGAVEKLANSQGAIPVEQWERALDFVRNFADKCHHLKEEGLLFPALEEHGIPREGGPIGVMLMEHEEGRGYVRAMAEALSAVKQQPEAGRPKLVGNARAYVRLLREHILKEDDILFNMADDVLTPEEQKELLREFEEHEARELEPGVHEKYLAIALELERFQG